MSDADERAKDQELLPKEDVKKAQEEASHSAGCSSFRAAGGIADMLSTLSLNDGDTYLLSEDLKRQLQEKGDLLEWERDHWYQDREQVARLLHQKDSEHKRLIESYQDWVQRLECLLLVIEVGREDDHRRYEKKLGELKEEIRQQQEQIRQLQEEISCQTPEQTKES